jgi:hypothetical protein
MELTTASIVIASKAKQSSRAVMESASFAHAGLDCFPFASLWVAMTVIYAVPVSCDASGTRRHG